jgi:hypothetical protein
MRQMQMADKIAGETAEQLKKQAFDETRAGTMTADKLKAMEPMFKKAADWEAVNKFFYGGASFDDTHTLTTLNAEIGKPGAMNSITDAVNAHQITTATADQLMNKQRELEKENQPMSPYRGGRETLERMFDARAVGIKNEFMAAAMQKVGVGAMTEFNDRFRNLSPQDRLNPGKVNEIVDDIVTRDGTDFVNNSRQGMNLPRFLDGAISRDKISAQNLMGAMDRTEELFAAGQISAEEHATEIRRLQAWKHLLEYEATLPKPEQKPEKK